MLTEEPIGTNAKENTSEYINVQINKIRKQRKQKIRSRYESFKLKQKQNTHTANKKKHTLH